MWHFRFRLLLFGAGLSVTAAADVLQVSRPALSSLLNSKAALSGDMALRIEKASISNGITARHRGFEEHGVRVRRLRLRGLSLTAGELADVGWSQD